jgi:ATP-binding cassette subfamily B protein
MNELKRLLPYLRRHRARLLLGFLFVTISNVCSTAIPRFVGTIVDGMRGSSFTMDDVVLNIMKILLLTAGSGFFMFLTRRTIIVASRLIEYELRNDLLLAIEHQSLAFFHKNPTGTLMALSTNDISAMREFLGPAIMYSANTITTFLFALALMGSLNPEITTIALIPLPLMAWLTYKIGQKVHVGFRDVQEQFSQLTAQAQEAFSSVRVVRAYQREEHEYQQFKGNAEEYKNRNIRLARLQSLTMPAMMMLVGLSNLLVLGYGGLQVIEGHATLGDITQFFIYLNQLIWPVAAIGWVTNLIQRAAASARRVGQIMDTTPSIQDSENAGTQPPADTSVELKNISMQYPGRKEKALANISLRIPAGSSLGIVGATGSGKSTLASLLPRLYDPTEGNILIGDKDIREIPLSTLRGMMGLVQQEPFLFSMSVSENIRFGSPGSTQEQIQAAATLAGLHQDITEFSKGYNTIVGERGITLSGGQKQRTAIARAIVRNPGILILDDAFSAVDTATEEKILEGLKTLMHNRTTILIAHRLSTVALCSQIIVLDQGHIAEYGTHQELLAAGGLYTAMYERQQLEAEISGYQD